MSFELKTRFTQNNKIMPEKEKENPISSSLQETNTNTELVESFKLEALKIPNSISFNLPNRNLREIPGEIGLLTSLDRLGFNNNKLTALPLELSNLTALRYLNLKSNLLKDFPPVLMQLQSLEVLDMSRNNIERFPSDFGNLIRLRVLSISYNQIRELPKYFYQMKRLEHFRLEHNPISWPPPSILFCEISTEQKSWLESLRNYILNNDPPVAAIHPKSHSRDDSVSFSLSENVPETSFEIDTRTFKDVTQTSPEDKFVQDAQVSISPVVSPSALTMKSCQEVLHLFVIGHQSILDELILKYPFIDSYLSILFGSVEIYAVSHHMKLLAEKLSIDISTLEKSMESVNYQILVLIKSLKGSLAENNISQERLLSLKKDISSLILNTKRMTQICISSVLSSMESLDRSVDNRILNRIILDWKNANELFSQAMVTFMGGQKNLLYHIEHESLSSSCSDLFLNLYSLLDSLEKNEASSFSSNTHKLLLESLLHCNTKDVLSFLESLSEFLSDCRKIQKKSISQTCLLISTLAQSLIKVADV